MIKRTSAEDYIYKHAAILDREICGLPVVIYIFGSEHLNALDFLSKCKRWKGINIIEPVKIRDAQKRDIAILHILHEIRRSRRGRITRAQSEVLIYN